jgi:hypothetical protein
MRMKLTYEDLSIECWDWFLSEIGLVFDDIEQSDVSTLEQIISEGAAFDESAEQIVRRMIRFWVGEINSWDKNVEECDDDIENNNWLSGLSKVVTIKEKNYDN